MNTMRGLLSRDTDERGVKKDRMPRTDSAFAAPFTTEAIIDSRTVKESPAMKQNTSLASSIMASLRRKINKTDSS